MATHLALAMTVMGGVVTLDVPCFLVGLTPPNHLVFQQHPHLHPSSQSSMHLVMHSAAAELHLGMPDPPDKFWLDIISAICATALFRCWHLQVLLFFTGWITAISDISHTHYTTTMIWSDHTPTGTLQ
jgi:hypothetical protein